MLNSGNWFIDLLHSVLFNSQEAELYCKRSLPCSLARSTSGEKYSCGVTQSFSTSNLYWIIRIFYLTLNMNHLSESVKHQSLRNRNIKYWYYRSLEHSNYASFSLARRGQVKRLIIAPDNRITTFFFSLLQCPILWPLLQKCPSRIPWTS